MKKKEENTSKEASYRRMTWNDRLFIEKLYNSGQKYRAIAKAIGFAVSSTHTEIQHGLYDHLDGSTWKTVRKYSAEIAQLYSDWQATSKGVPIKLEKRYDYANYVAERIQKGRSPDQITGRLKREKKWTVSTSTLYRYIDKGYIPGVTNKSLLEKPKRKRSYRHVKAKRPPKGTSIERRPEEVNSRTTFGHWELDSVIGKAKGTRQSLLVLTERLTRYEIILRVQSKEMAESVKALRSIIPKYPKGTFKTITVDNGSEFQDCNGMEQDENDNKQLTVYYCHPYTSCERGSNERNNRIFRRYHPKGESLYDVTQDDCDRIADDMNDMPRKILGYATARELFEQELAKLTP